MQQVNIQEPLKDPPVNVFKSSPALESAIKKMVENPSLLQNFLRMFVKTPKIPSKTTAPPPPPPAKVARNKYNRSITPINTDFDIPDFGEMSATPPAQDYRPSRILTPTWDAADSDFSSHSAKSSSKTQSYDLVLMHQSLEIFESRMFTDPNTKYFHSGQLLDIAESNPPKPQTETERKKIERYNTKTVPKKIPNTWVRRPWDKPEMVMTEAETLDLQQAILNNSVAAMDPQNWNLNNKKKTRRNHISRTESDNRFHRKKKTILTLSSLSYATDCSDEETDWSDFDF